MIWQDWQHLVVLSFKQPAVAARVLMGLRFGPSALWQALILVAIANTFLFVISIDYMNVSSPYPDSFSVPLVNFVTMAIGMVFMVLALFLAGKLMGGLARFEDILVLMVWMQIIQVAIKAVALLLIPVAPTIAALLMLLGGLVGIYLMVHFVNQAHEFASLGKSALVLFGGLLAVAVALSLFTVMIGGADV